MYMYLCIESKVVVCSFPKIKQYHSIDSLYSTNSVNVYVPSDNQQFGIKLREGGKYFNGFLTKIIIPRS